ncbi:DUF4132 domain-containing protein [Paenibacillus sp. CFBP 13594]|uniref:DUF4132 domain-containing protein n=1 Tax=Paenibacillus sp. CFBP 13594 TaxID=2774037 RepID=UPI001785E595|nr:DUF4132 domain-containing protein [Paenibacillus sp. CFBP 13594]MBD8836834.1 DUF4132 domain-containing protein [Paenibacillus sp. CFBP 13594]
MLTTDRALETLVEKFAVTCSNEYSLKTDRSSEIIDYVLGTSDKFPDMLGNSSHYVYQTIDLLMKLAKKEDGDIFYRAGAIVIYLESTYSKRNTWRTDAFTICMGNDSEAYGLSGKSKSSDRMGGLLARLEKIKQFAGENEILAELKSKLKRAQWLFDSKKADSQGNYRDVINALMLLQLYSKLSNTPSHAEVESSAQSLPALFQHVMANDPDQLREELHTLIEPVVVSNIQGKHNGSSQELKDEFLKQKRNQLIAELYPNTSFSPKEQCSHAVFHQTMVLVSSALLYLINISGGKQRFLDANSEIGHVLLHTLHQLHEIYPLEVRSYLLSMDPRAKSPNDLLAGLVPLDEPYQLVEMLRDELNSYTVSWNMLQSAIANRPEQAIRAYEIIKPPFLKLCIQKFMEDQGLALPNAEESVEQAVFNALRHPLDGGRQGIAIARYLSGENTLEEYWEDPNSRGLFNQLNRDKKRVHNLISISFLPLDSEAMRRFAILTTHPDWTLDIVSDMYNSYAFSGEQLLQRYGQDPEVKREKLLTSLISLNGMTDYRYKSMPHDEYRRIIQQNLDYALTQYKKLPTDTRILILEITFEQRDELSKKILAEAIRAGLQDSSKKASGVALAEFNRIPDQDLYTLVYLSEKKAGIKEMALTAIRSLENSKELYGELLKKEKAADWKNLIQILLNTADLSPEYAHAALADQADSKKLSRLSWLSLKDLPSLMRTEDNQPLDDRIKLYVLVQSLDHTSGPNERLNELRDYVSEASLVRFASELLQVWIQEGAPAKEKWVMYVSALFGDIQIVNILTPQIKEWTENSRGAIAADAVKVLAYLKDPSALMAIDKIKRSVKNRQVKGAAEEALQLAADNMGLTAEQLEDRLVTTLGFDEKGTMQLSYGERSFLVKVNGDLQVVVLNEETGKSVKSLPAPAQKDDADLAAQSKARFTQLKKDLKSMVNIQAQRLEESLSKQRLWSADEWKALFVQNVIMQKFAVGLIWGTYEDGALISTFRYMEDGTFNSVDEDEVDLPSGAQVGLIHPLELDQVTLEGWTTQLEDYEIKQPFEQLNREIHQPEDEDKTKNEYDHLPESDFSPTAFPKVLEKYGWIKGPAQDGGWYHEFYKEYGDLVAELQFSGTSITYYEGLDDITLESLHFFKPNNKQYYYYGDNKPIALGNVPGRVFSETIYDILRATGR